MKFSELSEVTMGTLVPNTEQRINFLIGLHNGNESENRKSIVAITYLNYWRTDISLPQTYLKKIIRWSPLSKTFEIVIWKPDSKGDNRCLLISMR